MKKIYLSVILVFCAVAGFSATWYSSGTSAGGDASNLGSWWSNSDGTGTNPTTFANDTDTWVMQSDMTSDTAFTIGGSLTINDVSFNYAPSTMNIGRDLTMTGSANVSTGEDGNYVTIHLNGNLNVLDASYFYNDPEYTIIEFGNTASTFSTPQNITWTSTEPGEYARILIDANSFVQLQSNVTMPTNPGGADVVNGSLICGTYVFNTNTSFFFFPLTINSGGSLYTANVNGINGSVQSGFYNFSSGANYIFNGTAHQVTGTLLPAALTAGGSVTINNNSGVTLSQSTSFGDTSTLTLANGNLSLGDNQLNMSANATLAGAFSGTHMVVTNGAGALQKQFIANGSFVYPIGDSSNNYSPISLNVSGTFDPGAYVGAHVTNAKQPNNHNATDYLNRYWTITSSGVSGLSYDVAATYVQSDVVGNEGDIVLGEYTGVLPWHSFTGSADTAANTLSTVDVIDATADFSGISLPFVTLPHTATICSGDTATISVLTIGTDTSNTYVWTPTTGIVMNNGSMISADPTVSTTYTLTITDSNGNSTFDTVAVTVNPKPAVQEIAGGGTGCSSAGVPVGFNVTDTGVSYQLYRDGIATDAPMNGTGGVLSFTTDTTGNYTAVATGLHGGCTTNMFGYVTVSINPSPAVDTVTGGGGYCAGGAGVHIGLNTSASGVGYQLFDGFVTESGVIHGNGAAIDFGSFTDGGSYTVVATDSISGCTTVMADTAVVTVNALPNAYYVTGGGSYCSGTGGLTISLDGSDTGVKYQLYLNDTGIIGSPVAGTGNGFDFGMDTAEGLYTAIATDTITGCTSNMLDGAYISVIPSVVPTVSIEQSIDSICEGTDVEFYANNTNGGEPEITWMVNDTVVSYGYYFDYVPRNGDELSVQLVSSATCANPGTVMDSVNLRVQSHQTPVVTITVSPNDTVCANTNVVMTAMPTFGGSDPSYAWVKNMAVVSTDTFYAFTPVDGDNVYCVMQSDYYCLATTTAYSNVINMTVEDAVAPVVTISAHPGTMLTTGQTDTIVATVPGGNVTYQWYVNGSAIPNATNSTYTQTTFHENDSVSVVVTRNDACALTNFNSLIIKVGRLDVKQTAAAVNDVKLSPNPNNGTFTVTGTVGAAGTNEQVSMEITDMLGQTVYKTSAMSQDGTISMMVHMDNTIANGIYLMNLRSESGNSTIRFVVGQ